MLLSVICSQVLADGWEDARTLYKSGKSREALAALQASPEENSAWYYNMGTLKFSLQEYGVALAYLEKADRLQPRDSEIRNNLEMARDVVSRKLGSDALDPASTWIEEIASRVPLEEIRGVFALLVLVTLLIWTRTYRRTRSLSRTIFQPAGYFGIVAFSLLSFLFVAQRIAESEPPAAVIESDRILSGPGEQFAVLATLEPGMKVRVTGSHSAENAAWYQVRYSKDGGIGWVPASSLLLL